MPDRPRVEIRDFSYYFDLSTFAHRGLFEPCAYLFDFIKLLPGYVAERARPEIRGRVMAGAWIGDQVYLGEGSVVQPGAWVAGPAIIGKNCEIRHGAYVGANVVCGDGVVIGHASEVGHAVFLDGSRAPHFAFVGHSILGNRVNLGAGTKLSNFKITGQDVEIAGVPSGLAKVGAFIGDESSLGCNTITQPATFLGKRVYCYPNMTLRGFVPSETILKLRQQHEEDRFRAR